MSPTYKGSQAWVTAAVEEKAVEKVLLLATSLREMLTSKQLVVLTTLNVSKDSREKLKTMFDIVLIIEQGFEEGQDQESYAKAQAFSFQAFEKCVYLSPETMILKNCDGIFNRPETFSGCIRGSEIDSSVYIFTPSRNYGKVFEGFIKLINEPGAFSKQFNEWMAQEFQTGFDLNHRFNHKINLGSKLDGCPNYDVAILNFSSVHPLEIEESQLKSLLIDGGPLQKFAVDTFLRNQAKMKLYLEKDLPIYPENPNGIESIAVVGLSFRLPGGNNEEELWELLRNGQEGIKRMPEYRFQEDQWYTKCHDRNIEAGFLDFPLGDFDAKFFGISPKDAEQLDPQQRLLHEVSWEALEDAMIDPHSLRGTQTGIFSGSWLHDYRDIAYNQWEVEFLRNYLGNSIASETARLSHFLETNGPSIATESGCSSSIVAVHMACKSLLNRESELALACGVNLFFRPFDYDTLNVVLSKTGRCHTFDVKADGFARAEGCAVLVLKRLSDALQDGNKIWGLIKGSAITQEGQSKSLGTPTVHCESLAMELALRDGGVSPEDVSYVEAHGTGTPVGDPLEVAAIKKAYSTPKRAKPLIVGSVKTNLGHTESVSGIAGIIKVLLSMKNEMIPQHLNLETLNPALDLDAIPAQIPMKPIAWPKIKGKPRIAGVSSFGISGTDGHAILQESPIFPEYKLDYNKERPTHVMKISAKCPESFQKLLLKYEQIFTKKAGEIEEKYDFCDYAYSANIGRANFNIRTAIIARDFKEAGKILREKSFVEKEVEKGRKLCFLFPGQGSQYPNMGLSLYNTSPIFQECFDYCDEILKTQYKIDIRNVLWGKDLDKSLNRTLYSQTSIFVVEYCLLKLWESWGVVPDYVVGHSLGEFAAAVAAGVLNIDEALMLVAERTLLIDNLPQGKMLVIKSGKDVVQGVIAELENNSDSRFWVDIAAINAPDQIVVAGDTNHIEELARICNERSIKALILPATHAFHSRHMDPILKSYGKVASAIPTRSGTSPKYISGMEGKVIRIEDVNSNYWVRHTREQVRFTDACKTAEGENCSLFLEIGPHPLLSAFILGNSQGLNLTCLPSLRRGHEDWMNMMESCKALYLSDWKGEIDWKGFDRHYTRKLVSLPFHPFIRKPTWIRSWYQPGRAHPLLGKCITNATGGNIFENEVNFKPLGYLQDHVIGNQIVFPGAGFLEMCLACGFFAMQGIVEDFTAPKRPLVLNDLQIHSPLALEESKLCVLQTTANMFEGELEKVDFQMGYKVNVYRQTNIKFNEGIKPPKWTLHASAKFIPAGNIPADIPKRVDIVEIKSSWVNYNTTHFYKNLPSVGLHFGNTFQTLTKGWHCPNGILFRVKKPEISSNYLIHPVVADAMIQAVMILKNKETLQRKLQVPIQIGEFILFEQAVSNLHYVFASVSDNETVFAVLLDETGKTLAYMGEIEFMETNVKLLQSILQTQDTTIALPDMWQEIYKSAPGPLQRTILFEENFALSETQCILERKEAHNILKKMGDKNQLEMFQIYSTLPELYFLGAIYKLGWKPEIGEMFSAAEIMLDLGIEDVHLGYCHFFFKQLAKLNFLKINSGPNYTSKFTIINLPFTKEQVEKEIEQKLEYSNNQNVIIKLIREVGESLKEIVTGKENPLSFLFPTLESKPNAESFYREILNKLGLSGRAMFMEKVVPILQQATERARNNKITNPKIRIIEIGAGSGAFTEMFKKCLELAGLSDYEYWYTDISGAFELHANQIFEDSPEKLIFKKFDMEKDPLSQGLFPNHFDLVFCFEVIHIAKDIRNALRNIRALLKPGGVLQIIETIQPYPIYTFTFGLLKGYWQFEDTDIRPDHTTISLCKWKELLETSGFCSVVHAPMYLDAHGFIYCRKSKILEQKHGANQPTWIIFEENLSVRDHLESLGRNVISVANPQKSLTEEEADKLVADCLISAGCGHLEGIIYMWSLSSTDQSIVCLPFFTLCKHLSKRKNPPKLVILTQGGFCVDDYSEMLNPSHGTVLGVAKSAINELNLNIIHMDLSPMDHTGNQVEEICSNLWLDDEPTLIFRNGKRFIPKLIKDNNPNQSLSLPNGCSRFQLLLPKTRIITDLEFGFLEPFHLTDFEIEVEVKATALNFIDVFVVLKPIKFFESVNSVGLDFAGIVTRVGSKVTRWKVGDRVIGMNPGEHSLPSHVKLNEKIAVPLPNAMTFVEGATLPAVSSTVIHSLVNVAKLKPGEVLLLHTATGGVGLCAIQLAKHLGVEVIATAGSQRKRNYLKRLGIAHVFNSRTTEFGKQVLKVTGGNGVNVVLNSLTGKGFKEASLNTLAPNGRFIEMSKLNIWTKDEVASIRPDVFYEVVDLKGFNEKQFEQICVLLKEYISKEIFTPIPYETFSALDICTGLTYLQQAKHIGKVVCISPELKVEHSNVIVKTLLFNDRSTYIITGGLGGIGLEVAKYMIENGAKHIVLISRSKPKEATQNLIDKWNGSGFHVEAFAVDVGNYKELKITFDFLKSSSSGFPKIRGVMHAAGVLSDGIIANQTWTSFLHTFAPKVNGTRNLHELTKDLLLEHFVLFSSMAATVGSPGQSNHSASNSFEDAFALYRKSLGLPATCINWGNWGEVGVATEIDFPGLRPITTKQGLLALETMIRTQWPRALVMNAEYLTLTTKVFTTLKKYIEDKSLLVDDKTCTDLLTSDKFWQQVDKAVTIDEKILIFKEFIKSVVRSTVKLSKNEIIDDQSDFQSLGIDSLMMIEMKNRLQSVLEKRIKFSTEQMRSCTNTLMLAKCFVELLERKDSIPAGKVKPPSIEEFQKLIYEDSQITNDIITNDLKKVSEIRSVFLTGATGLLGPYILRELTNRASIVRVFCLIREKTGDFPNVRLEKRLKDLGLINQVNLDKIECIEGDLTEERFGLSWEVYQDLACKTDAIIHCAVRSDQKEIYCKMTNSKQNLRCVNVIGTQRVLKFAAEQTLKHVFYASTIFAVSSLTNESFSEDWINWENTQKINCNQGYSISKVISEQLVKTAVERGIPGKVFRFSMLGGDSVTGRSEYLQNHVFRRWMAYLKQRSVMNNPPPIQILPVDYSAKFSVEVFLNPEAPSGVYCVCHRQENVNQVLTGIAKELGLDVQQPPASFFVEKSKKDKDEQKFFPTVLKMEQFLQNFKECECIEECIKREIAFLQQSGVLAKLGI